MRANEGDAYPLGALQIGTRVHCIEIHKGHLAHTIRAAGTYGTIMRKIDGHVVVQIPGKREIAYNEECMATVGKAHRPMVHIGWDFPTGNEFLCLS